MSDTIRVFALMYGLLVALGCAGIWVLAILPQNTGVGFVSMFGVQVFVISGTALVLVSILGVLAMLGGVSLAILSGVDLALAQRRPGQW